MKIQQINKKAMILSHKDIELYVNLATGDAFALFKYLSTREKCLKALNNKNSIKKINCFYVSPRYLKIKKIDEAKYLLYLIFKYPNEGYFINKKLRQLKKDKK